ncbi:hypothetical protein PRK78_004505 [Emydomyces testavorans]|uniref:Uncharacterized protein n=1 Tax=Emydomyces testavorans TaxID=2070801 RepID=A0AAF0IJL8_9EURO|nr:hypothetical protein PRK78_004505 [Emydomyces testavorans]
MSTKVWILVYVGDPMDYSKYRHTSLYVEFDDDAENEGTVFHITGAHGFFKFEERKQYDPSKSIKLRKKVEVGEISAEVPKLAIRSILAATKVRNGIDDGDWNCQNWVGDALQQLVDQSWLSAELRDNAIDQMLDACLEAEDE